MGRERIDREGVRCFGSSFRVGEDDWKRGGILESCEEEVEVDRGGRCEAEGERKNFFVGRTQ
jgi:hypothetical protein